MTQDADIQAILEWFAQRPEHRHTSPELNPVLNRLSARDEILVPRTVLDRLLEGAEYYGDGRSVGPEAQLIEEACEWVRAICN